jgi:hypothetical protein
MVILTGHLADRRLLAARFEANWSSLIGAFHGAFDALGDEPDADWLMGVSGHAFRAAFSNDAGSLIGSETWLSVDHADSLGLYRNMGRDLDLIHARAAEPGFAAAKDEAVRRIEKSIDRGTPVIAQGLHTPEFGIIRGYNKKTRAFYVSTISQEQTGEAMPIAAWPPGPERRLNVFLIGKRRTVSPDQAIRAAITFACEYAELGETTEPGNEARVTHGFKAFDDWAKGLAGGLPLNAMAHAYNIQCVLSARRHAASFLDRFALETAVSGRLLAAAAAYRDEVLAWTRLASLFPYPGVGEIEGLAARLEGSRYLLQALVHERVAVEHLREALAVWN